MRYHAVACDYDGTLARDGRVQEDTLAALERLRQSGRQLILVTGRELDDLQRVCARLDLFDRVVAENGALLYRPATREERLLGERPPEVFVRRLRAAGVSPLSVGRAIVATWEPHETTVLAAIRHLGLELHVIFNKGAVMVLPSGVNKATGLGAALSELGLSPHNVVGIGDAENDHSFLSVCECAVAVANALPMLKAHADLVTSGEHGAGVIELSEALLRHDLRNLDSRLTRHHLLLGTCDNGTEVRLPPYGMSLLIAGPSGGGKSTLATGFLERLGEQHYQFCIIDPEGDYSTFEGAVVLGDEHRVPTAIEVLELLEQPGQNVVVNLIGLTLASRPTFFDSLLPQVQALRARTGRPHWLVIDEAHHLLPASWNLSAITLPQEFHGLVLITVHPESVSRAVLSVVDLLIAVGATPERTLGAFSAALDQEPPACAPVALAAGEALGWWRRTTPAPFWFRSVPPQGERRRHHRKYAEGELAPESSFYFRGAAGKLHLRAQNLVIFLQLADGVDDETWQYHLRRGEYSRWLGEVVKDSELAQEVAQIEGRDDLSTQESRTLIRAAIEKRYTASA